MKSGESLPEHITPNDALRMDGIRLAHRELAHRVNNHLGLIIGPLELVLDDPTLSPESRGLLETAMRAAESISTTVTKFGAIKRIVLADTPMGEAIDLDKSTEPNPPATNPLT